METNDLHEVGEDKRPHISMFCSNHGGFPIHHYELAGYPGDQQNLTDIHRLAFGRRMDRGVHLSNFRITIITAMSLLW